MAKLKEPERPRDNAVWNDDYVEIFLITDKDPETPYHQFIFTPSCSIYDAYKKKRAFNCNNLQVKTAKQEKSWTIEIAIPLEDLKFEEGKKTKLPYTWRLSINRFRSAKKGDDWEETAWTPTYKQTSKVPEMFAIVNIDNDPADAGVEESH